MKFKIFKRWSSEVKLEVEIGAEFEDRAASIQRGEAVRVAIKEKADLRGADLREAYLREADLGGADLREADLREAYLREAYLRGADLREADLRGADLREAYLRGADLRGADLRGADLGGADLRDIADTIRVPSLHRRILAAIDGGGTLDMSCWHTCETTHCRAGWSIHLAGPAGKVLEYCYGSAVAAALIHTVSCPQLEGKVPDFHATDEAALADICRLAELEPPLAVGV